jgi:hypothetical protein
MYLFTRAVRLAPGHARDGMEWAVSLTEKVNQITALNVGLWTPVMSPAVGTLSFGCAVESATDIEDAEAKLNVEPMYLDAIERGAAMLASGADDELAQFLYNPDQTPNPTHVAVVRTVIANGSFQRGVEVGIEIAQRATQLGTCPTSFLLATTGTYAGCGWISSAHSLKELEESEQAVNANPDFVSFLDSEASSCYLPGITTQSIWRRVV